MDIRKIMDKRSVQQKKGLLTDAEIQKLVTEWQDERGEEDLEQATIDREVRTMEEKLNKYKFLHSEKTDPFGFWYAKWVAVPERRLGNNRSQPRRG
jgi:hypothetical protein